MKKPFPTVRLRTITRANIDRVVARFGVKNAESIAAILCGRGDNGVSFAEERHVARVRKLYPC